MVTHPRAFEDSKAVVGRAREKTGLPVSVLAAPTLIADPAQLGEIRERGADCLGVAMDLPTPELFSRHRGAGVGGPHRWDHYWQVARWGLEAFGPRRVSVHLIVGLGETEREMIETVQEAWDLGAVPHLFSFFPEGGSLLAGEGQPPIGRYRRVQLARHMIASEAVRADRMTFGEAGEVLDFGVDVTSFLRDGSAFRTSGCAGSNGEVACNRPYGNERPGGILYNYPFRLDEEDLGAVARELRDGTGGRRP
jgi:biotin synthase